MSNEQARREEQGRRVKMARTGAGLSREKFAERVAPLWEHVSREYIRRVEIGEKDPGLGFLLAAAEVTEWPLPWFTELEGDVIHVMSSDGRWLLQPVGVTNSTVRAHDTTDRDYRPIDAYAEADKIAA